MRGKKIIIFSVLILFICCSFVLKVFNEKQNFENILSTLNGFEVEKETKRYSDWQENYINSTFFEDNSKFILLEDVNIFNKYVDNMKVKMQNVGSEDTFYIPPIEDAVDLQQYYTPIQKNKDSRIFLENNKLCVYYKDFHFGIDVDYPNYDFFEYDHFYRAVNKNEIMKKTVSQAQQDMSVEFVDKYKEDGKTIYVYFDTDTNKTIKVAVKTILGFVTSCETVY